MARSSSENRPNLRRKSFSKNRRSREVEALKSERASSPKPLSTMTREDRARRSSQLSKRTRHHSLPANFSSTLSSGSTRSMRTTRSSSSKGVSTRNRNESRGRGVSEREKRLNTNAPQQSKTDKKERRISPRRSTGTRTDSPSSRSDISNANNSEPTLSDYCKRSSQDFKFDRRHDHSFSRSRSSGRFTDASSRSGSHPSGKSANGAGNLRSDNNGTKSNRSSSSHAAAETTRDVPVPKKKKYALSLPEQKDGTQSKNSIESCLEPASKPINHTKGSNKNTSDISRESRSTHKMTLSESKKEKKMRRREEMEKNLEMISSDSDQDMETNMNTVANSSISNALNDSTKKKESLLPKDKVTRTPKKKKNNHEEQNLATDREEQGKAQMDFSLNNNVGEKYKIRNDNGHASHQKLTPKQKSNKKSVDLNDEDNCVNDDVGCNRLHDIPLSSCFDLSHTKVDPKLCVCWSCNVPLHHKHFTPSPDEESDSECSQIEMQKEEIDSSDDELTEKNFSNSKRLKKPWLYAIHAHPLLQITTCSPCVDRAYMVEDDVQEALMQERRKRIGLEEENGENDFHNSNSVGDTCSWCAGAATDKNGDDYDLIMCDVCPRGFCKRCVAIAHGGIDGWNAVSRILKDEGEWSCIHCLKPDVLSSMQAFMKNKAEKTEESGKTQEKREILKDISDDDSVEKLVEELETLEYGIEQANARLEEDSKKKYRDRIRKEMVESMSPKKRKAIGEGGIDELVEEEVECWVEQWRDHADRLADNVTDLQDLLSDRGINLTAFYSELVKGRDQGKRIQNMSDSDEPTWKKAADAELDELDAKSGFLKGEFKGSSGYQLRDDRDLDELEKWELDEVEEINTTYESLKTIEGIVGRKNSQWGTKSGNERDIRNFRKAIPIEDAELADLNVNVIKRSSTEIEDVKKENKNMNKDFCRNSKSGEKVVFREKKQLDRKVKICSRIDRKSIRRKRSLNTSQNKSPTSDKRKKRRIEPQLLPDKNINEVGRFHSGSRNASYEDSDLVLATIPNGEDNSKTNKKSRNQNKNDVVSIAQPLTDVLKPHQKDGIKFMWDLVCMDVPALTQNKKTLAGISHESVRGCILAHNMGLGKSLQVVSLLHCLLTHPLLATNETLTNAFNHNIGIKSRTIQRVLLVVPVNTIANWQNEFIIWIGKKNIPQIHLYNMNDTLANSGSRSGLVKEWISNGGVMVASYDSLARICKPILGAIEKKAQINHIGETYLKAFLWPGPDMVVLDEAHLMLKNNKSDISKTLSFMKTSRRIALTGTPLQNNLIEYYRMASWVKPGCLGTEIHFERNYAIPIMDSLAADSSKEAMEKGEALSQELWSSLLPFVQRLDSRVLAKDLPSMQQAVIHVRQSKIQAKLYRAFQQYQKRTMNNNFFDQYHKLFPVNNHPGCLLIRKDDRSASPNDEYLSPKGEKRASISPAKNQQHDTSLDVIDLMNSDSESVSESIANKIDHSTNVRDRNISPETKSTPGKVNGLTITGASNVSNAESNKSNTDETRVSDNKKENLNNNKMFSEAGRPNDSADSNGDKSTFAQNVMHGKSVSFVSPSTSESWWEQVFQRNPDMGDVLNGGKIVLLLQILAHADLIGEKVVVFAQCLKTLDYIESILNTSNWGEKIPSIASLSTGKEWGPWRKNIEYLRIDGSTTASQRGDLVNQFNDKTSESFSSIAGSGVHNDAEETSKVFLISSKAGGIGINLVAANRVVLFDSHWNPAVDLQALYRCYRYGQDKPVYAYRLLTEGSMEEKVYSRSVNKTNLAARVIDQRYPERSFTASEMANILENDTWVQCDKCDKWRMLPPCHQDVDNLPEKWFCSMNIFDKPRSNCSAKERDKKYYHELFTRVSAMPPGSTEIGMHPPIGKESIDDKPIDDAEKALCTKRDVILSRLLAVPGSSSSKEKKTKKEKSSSVALISQYHFHDSLLKDADDHDSDVESPASTANIPSDELSKGNINHAQTSNTLSTARSTDILQDSEKSKSSSDHDNQGKIPARNSTDKNDSNRSNTKDNKERFAVKKTHQGKLGEDQGKVTPDIKFDNNSTKAGNIETDRSKMSSSKKKSGRIKSGNGDRKYHAPQNLEIISIDSCSDGESY